MEALKLNYNTALFKLCFDSKTSGLITGQRLRETIPFSDLPETLLKIDCVMDMQNYPRAFQRKRQFGNTERKAASVPYAASLEEMLSEEAVDRCSGAIATLLLQVMTRQNSTWQGSVTSNSERFRFDSVLQLLEIIDKLTD